MILDCVLNTIENEDIRRFAEECIKTIPPYWYKVPASSSGKYHPQFSLGDGGLLRHTIAVIKYLNYMFEIESVADQFTSRERDLIRVAALMHDSRKSGSQEDYEKSKWTVFDHPLQAAIVVRKLNGLPKNEIEFVAHCIESHMGQWNSDKRSPNVVLPKPEDKYQIILHEADYLASRKEIDMKFPELDSAEEVTDPQNIDPKTCLVGFGKYRDITVQELHEKHPDYIAYLQKGGDFRQEPCRTALLKLGYKF